MEKFAACPHCNYRVVEEGDLLFVERDVVCVDAPFRPVVTESGEIKYDWTGYSEVFWDSQVPARDLDKVTPLFRCLRCGGQFNEFVIHDADFPDVTDAVEAVVSGEDPDDLIAPRRGN